jgi:hypothetical protein
VRNAPRSASLLIGITVLFLSGGPAGGDGPGQLGCGVPFIIPDANDLTCKLKRNAMCVIEGVPLVPFGSDTCGWKSGTGGGPMDCGLPAQNGALCQ